MNALLLSAMLLAPADLQAPVTFRGAGSSVLTLVQEMSKASGTPMDVAEPRGWSLFARIEKQPVRAVMDQLAKATDAVWTKRDDGTWVLTRDRARQLAAIQVENQSRAADLEVARKRVVESLRGSEDWSAEGMEKRRAERQKQMQEMTRGLPAGIEIDLGGFSQAASSLLAKRFLEQMPINAFASLAPGQRVVYSSFSPNRYQKALPFNSNKMISDFTKAWNIEQAARQGSNLRPQYSLPNGPGKVIFRLTRQGDGIGIRIVVGNPNGEYVTMYQTFLSVIPEEPKTLESPLDANFEVPALVRSFNQMGMGNSGGSTRTVRIAFSSNDGMMEFGGGSEAPVRREHFDTDEPWRMAIGDLYLQAAEKMNRNVLMVPDDSMFTRGFRLFSNQSVTAKQLINALPRFELSSEISENWWLIQPKNQARADRSRVNRAALNRLSQSMLKLGYCGLEELATYAEAMPRYAAQDNVDRFWLSKMNPGISDLVTYRTAPLFFYASMPAQFRRQNGQGAVAQLPGKASAEAWEFLASGDEFGQRLAVLGVPGEQVGGPRLSDYEFTELLGNAPLEGRFQLRWQNEDAIFAQSKGQICGRFMTPQMLGMTMGMRIESVGGGGPQIEAPRYEEFALGWQARVSFSVTHVSGAESQGMLNDGGFAANAKKGPLSALPEGVRTSIEEARKRAPQLRAGFGTRSNTTIPPSRD